MTIPKEPEDVLVSTADTLICNHTIDYFLEGFPDVTKEQAEAVLKWEQNRSRQLAVIPSR